MREKNGFSLVELLATIVILALVLGIAIYISNGAFLKAKAQSEDVFVKSLEDALDMFVDSSDVKDVTKAKVSDSPEYGLSKTSGYVYVYKIYKLEEDKSEREFTFDDVINSEYTPLTKADIVNPANKDVPCKTDGIIHIYRDSDYVYYYQIDKSSFGCLKASNGDDMKIGTLPNNVVPPVM